jgi:nitrite reductase/ring-hydroxylating ferredoxin subunit
MTSKSGWHPVALSMSIEPGSSAGTHIEGREYVVWRDKSCVAHVWEDRCPHRGMKLSFGFVRGDHIACLYHGWQYDTAGRCRYVPAHPDLEVPPTIKVPVFKAIEAMGMIWTTSAPDEERPTTPAGPSEVVPVRSLYVDTDSSALLAALQADPPSPFTGDGAPSTVSAGDNLWRISTGKDSLFAGIQNLGQNRAALHLVIDGPASVYAGAGQTHFLAWTTALRQALEDGSRRTQTQRAEAV